MIKCEICGSCNIVIHVFSGSSVGYGKIFCKDCQNHLAEFDEEQQPFDLNKFIQERNEATR